MLVLIIEDQEEIREALAEALELEGCVVSAASNGREGLAEARRGHPDLILLDLMMPVMNGWQFRAAQKRDPRIAGIPVVVVSAFADRGDIDVAGFISKPCTIDEVLGAVQRYHHPAPPPAAA